MVGEDLGESIRRRRRALKLSQARLAVLATEHAQVEINQQDIHRIEHGAFSRALPAIRQTLDILEGSPPPEPMAPVTPRAGLLPKPLPSSRGDLPVYASARGGPGEILFNYDPVDFVGRPDPVANVRDAYAMYIVGDSMEPALEQGDLAYVNPHLPARPGADVLIFRAWEGEFAAVVKRLVRPAAETTTGRWVCKQFNPVKQLEYKRVEWPKCHVIVFKQYSGR